MEGASTNKGGSEPPSASGSSVKVAVKIVKRVPRGGRCTICMSRKVKCSRSTPCERCVDKGQEEFCVVSPATTAEQTRLITKLQTEINSLRRQMTTAGIQNPTPPEEDDDSDSSPELEEEPPLDGDVMNSYLHAMGMPHAFSALSIGSGSKASKSDPKRPWKFRPSETSSPLDLVPRSRSRAIVAASLRFLNFLQCVVHVPTFVEEHAIWLRKLETANGGEDTRPEFLALYFGVISTGLYFVQGRLGATLGFTEDEMRTLPRLWFDASIECLYRSDFMSVPNMQAIQAILVLPVVSYSFGISAHVDHLIFASIRSAQSLGLHLLAAEVPGTASSGVIQREVGRRVWQLLRIFENNTYTGQKSPLFMPLAVTAPPTNINDEDLADNVVPFPYSPGTMSIATHMILVGRRAAIFRNLYQYMDASHQSSAALYQTLQHFDGQLLTLLDEYPALQQSDAPFPDESSISVHEAFDYVSWARYLWSLNIHASRIIFHRVFMAKLGVEGREGDPVETQIARKACLEAARAYLNQRKRPAPELYKKSWTVSTFAVLAGACLAAEYRHSSTGLLERHTLRMELQEVMDLLPQRDAKNRVIIRGSAGLRKMIEEGDVTLRRMLEEAEQVRQAERWTSSAMETIMGQPGIHWLQPLTAPNPNYWSESSAPVYGSSEWTWLEHF